jgi:hypothetical protein
MYPVRPTKATKLRIRGYGPGPGPARGYLAQIDALLSGPVVVTIHPRRNVARIWEKDHGKAMFTHPYAFRAYTRGNQSRLFTDETETPDSMLWLLLHELAHVELGRNPFLKAAYRKLPKPPGYLTSDTAHEAHPEEQFANLVANQWFSHLTGEPCIYDRLWWRKRVNRRQQ